MKIAYILDHDSLMRIVKILQEISELIEFTMTCSDDSKIECSSIDDVFAFANIKTRAITSISLVTPWGKRPQINVRFRSEKYRPVEYDVKGNDKEVYYFSGKLDEAISSLRQWYSKIAFVDIYLLLSLSLFIAYLLLIGFLMLVGKISIKQIVPKSFTGIELLPVLAIIFLDRLLNFLRVRIFPVAIFLIGDGIKRYKNILFWRRTVGVSFLLSILASLIASWLTK